jgi:ABC-2 type transport system permease protein
MLAFLLIGISWGIAFTGFPYAIALKTGNPIAVNNAFLLFFPFAFLTTAYVPQEQMTGWLATVADWNPVTYLLAGMRALLMTGWDGGAILRAFLASGIVAAISFTLAFTALRGRVRRK